MMNYEQNKYKNVKFTSSQFYLYAERYWKLCYEINLFGQDRLLENQSHSRQTRQTNWYSHFVLCFTYTYQDLLTGNLFNIFSFVYSSQPIRLRVSFFHRPIRPTRSRVRTGFFHVWGKTIRPIKSYFMGDKMALIYWIEKSRNIMNKKQHGKCFVRFLFVLFL
jgi:hypothetical protein